MTAFRTIIYDKTVYTIVVEVTETGGICRAAIVSINGKQTNAVRYSFTNIYEDINTPLSSLTVKKSIAGDGADKSKRFNFTVTIDGMGTTSFALAHGEGRVFTNIPVGTYYTVTED